MTFYLVSLVLVTFVVIERNFIGIFFTFKDTSLHVIMGFTKPVRHFLYFPTLHADKWPELPQRVSRVRRDLARFIWNVSQTTQRDRLSNTKTQEYGSFTHILMPWRKLMLKAVLENILTGVLGVVNIRWCQKVNWA